MIKCPNCGFENNDGTKFCNECGSSLTVSSEQDAVTETSSGTSPENNVAPAQIQPQNTKQVKKPVKTSNLCLAGLLLGIFAVLFSFMGMIQIIGFILAVIGIPLSIAGLSKVKKLKIGGKGMGIAGIILSCVALGICLIFLISGIVSGINAAKKEAELKNNAFGGTTKIFGYELTFGDDYDITYINDRYSESNGRTVIAIPVHVKRTGSDSDDPGMQLCYEFYNPNGAEIENASNDFNDGPYSCGSLLHNAESDYTLYFPYDGDGKYTIKIDTLNIWNTDEVTVGFPIEGTGIEDNETDSNTDTDKSDESSATRETTEAPVVTFEITDSNMYMYTDSISVNHYFAVFEITNTGNTTIEYDSARSSFEFEDSDGHFLMSADYPDALSEIIAPGEKCYVYDCGLIDSGISLDNGLNVLGHFEFVQANSNRTYFDYETSDTDIRDGGGYSGIVVTGRVTNNTNVDSRSFFKVGAVLYNSENKIVGVLDAYVDVSAGATVGFECSELSLGRYIGIENVDHYTIIARDVPAL